MLKNRQKKIISKMLPKSLLVLISQPARTRNNDVEYPYRLSSDLMYLTGTNQRNIALILTSNGKRLLFSEARTSETVRWHGLNISPKTIANSMEISNANIFSFDKLTSELPKLLQGCNHLYFNFADEEAIDKLVFNALKKSSASRGREIVPHIIIHAKEILHEMRLKKDVIELSTLKLACEISSNAHNKIMKFCKLKFQEKDSLFEYEVKSKIESYFMQNGPQELAYPSITAAGKNATILHYDKSTKKINHSDLILIDAGCEIDGYASDITRTFPAAGRFTEAQRQIYEIVLNANKLAIKNCLNKNMTLHKLHNLVVKYMTTQLWKLGLFKEIKIKDEKNKYKQIKPKNIKEVIDKKYYRIYFMHLTSHYLGLDVHDCGNYYIGKKARSIENGMVFTIEPGLYFPPEYDFIPKQYSGIGIRIEDDIAIRNNKIINLTETCLKEINDIESI